MKPVNAWWFAPTNRQLGNGDDRPIEVGTIHKHEGELMLCRSGLHASTNILHALNYAPGPIICRVKCGGKIVKGDDKLVCSERKYLTVIDGTETLRRFARLCALDVIDKWEAPDVVVKYLKTGDESLRIVARTAWAAAGAAAWAARTARAAGDAAWAKQRRRLTNMVMAEIKKQIAATTGD